MYGIKKPENSGKKKITGGDQLIKIINEIKFYFEICNFFFAEFSQVLQFSIFFFTCKEKSAYIILSFNTRQKHDRDLPFSGETSENRILKITLSLKNIGKKPPNLQEHVADCTCHITKDYNFLPEAPTFNKGKHNFQQKMLF